jgi:hypothetical protein
MKKNLVLQNNVPVVKVINNSNRQVQKYLALESHPRQKQLNDSTYNFAPSVIAMMF